MSVSIAGIDASITGTAVVRFDLDDNFELVKSSHISFSSVKKHSELPGVIFSKKEMYDSDMERFKYIQCTIMAFLHGVDFVAIEGYSMGSKGMVFNVGEFCGTLKMRLFEDGKKLQVYSPSEIKLFAGGPGKGRANKIDMKQFFDNYSHTNKPDLTGFPQVTRSSGNTPTSDIVDAFYICDMLWLELLLRKGLLTLGDCNTTEQTVFGVSKKYPGDPLGREFIQEKLYDI